MGTFQVEIKHRFNKERPETLLGLSYLSIIKATAYPIKWLMKIMIRCPHTSSNRNNNPWLWARNNSKRGKLKWSLIRWRSMDLTLILGIRVRIKWGQLTLRRLRIFSRVSRRTQTWSTTSSMVAHWLPTMLARESFHPTFNSERALVAKVWMAVVCKHL